MPHQTRGRDADKLVGHVEQALLELGLAHLPCAATQLVKRGFRRIGAVTGKKIDVFNRQEQLCIVGIMQFQAGARRTRCLDCPQADEATDTMLGMDYQRAFVQPRHFRDEIRTALAAFRAPHHAVAENILLADDRERPGFETRLKAQHRRGRLALAELLHLFQRGDRLDLLKPVLVQHLQQPVERTFRPACYQHLPALGAALGNMLHRQIENIDPFFALAFGWRTRPARPDMGVERGDRAAFAILLVEGCQTHRIDGDQCGIETLAVEIELAGRNRLVGRALRRSLGFAGAAARIVIIEHQLGALFCRLPRRVIGDDAETLEIIEGGFKSLVKQRQPVLHAGITAAFRDGLIKRVVTRRGTEQRQVILAETADRIRRQRHFAHRIQIE
ncbi:hypothetical protein D3C78_1008640 [compost metagenome]